MRRSIAAAACAWFVGSAAFAKPCPNIMLVLDQSGSMAQDPDGHDPPVGKSKWQLLQDVIIETVRQNGGSVPFGLELFSTDAWNDALKCEEAAMITVPLSHHSAGDIIRIIRAAAPNAQTNTGEAIKRAAQEMALASPNKPNYIILVTDGDPNCNPMDKGAGANPKDLRPIYTNKQIELARLQTPPIKTFVIGFDGDATSVHGAWLDDMAYWGGTRTHPGCGFGNMPSDPCYYRAGANQKEFQDVLDIILHEATGGEVLGALCDDSCYSVKCPMGQICTTDEVNSDPHCANDPCGGKTCSGDTFCRGGGCVQSCKDGCAGNQKCQDGKCVEDKCVGKSCGAGDGCNPNTGLCITLPCPICAPGSVCDFASAKCVADQCRIITCPNGTTCKNNGNCVGSGNGGCAAGRRADAAGFSTVALGLLSFFILMQRRAARR